MTGLAGSDAQRASPLVVDGDVGDGQPHIDDADRREADEGVAAQRLPADAFEGELAHCACPACGLKAALALLLL